MRTSIISYCRSLFLFVFATALFSLNGSNCSGEATQSRLAGRFAGMMMPVNLDSNEAQKFSHSA
jgi:hypothetical protein